MFEDIFNFSAASGPVPRKGDTALNPKGLVEGMKVGLRARDAKAGLPNSMTTARHDAEMQGSAAQQASAPSAMKEDLKIGLRAWYSKKGQLVETTTQPSVGASLPARSLGKQQWGGGSPSERRASPMEKGGSSLRKQIQSLERNLEATLVSLSNKRRFSETDEADFRNMLVDAVSDYLRTGNGGKFKELKMQATLVESSKFIGEPAPETSQVLTSDNDLGKAFSSKMSYYDGPITEMVATQLSSGTPLDVVRNNIATALRATVDSKTRGTLSKAAKVLAEM